MSTRSMNMDELDIKILRHLSKKKIISNAEIELTLGITERTFRNRIKGINSVINSWGTKIINQHGIGYRFDNIPKDIKEKIDSIEMNVSLHPNTREGRINFIINYVLLSPVPVEKQKLQEHLFISDSTMYATMKDVKKYFSKFDIKILDLEGKYYLEGHDQSIRSCLSSFIKESKLIYRELMFQEQQGKMINKITRRILDNHSYSVSLSNYENLCIHLSILVQINQSVQKFVQHHTDSEYHQELGLYVTDEQVEIAEELRTEIMKYFDIIIHESEVLYIAIHLAGKERLDSLVEVNSRLGVKTDRIINQFLENIHKNWGLNFKNDKQLIHNLSLHISPLIIRIESDTQKKHELRSAIKEQLSFAHILAYELYDVMFTEMGKGVSEDEISYIALHLELALTRMHDGNIKQNVLVICDSGRGTSELLRSMITQQFTDHIKDLNVMSDSRNLLHTDIGKYDLILSTVGDIQHLKKKSHQTFKKVDNFLDKEFVKWLNDYFLTNKSDGLKDVILEPLFFNLETKKTKEMILEEVVSKISDHIPIDPNFLELVLEREERSSTDYGNMVALPHPSVPASPKTVISISVLNEPIKWGTRLIQVICLMAISEDSNYKELQKLYKVLIKFITSEESVGQLIKVPTYENLMKILLETENDYE